MKRKQIASFPLEAVGMFGIAIYCGYHNSLPTGLIFAMVAGRWLRQWLNDA